MAEAPTKGWFILPGKEGDRTLDEQLLGLAPALEIARGKRVLDLGCAEGLISREFARAGASEVVGIEILERHVAEAEKQCAGLPCRFYAWHLERLYENGPAKDVLGKFDIVLALGVIHKLKFPAVGVWLACGMSCGSVVIRYPAYAESARQIIRSKHYGNTVYVPEIMEQACFELASTTDGPHGERVEYWARS